MQRRLRLLAVVGYFSLVGILFGIYRLHQYELRYTEQTASIDSFHIVNDSSSSLEIQLAFSMNAELPIVKVSVLPHKATISNLEGIHLGTVHLPLINLTNGWNNQTTIRTNFTILQADAFKVFLKDIMRGTNGTSALLLYSRPEIRSNRLRISSLFIPQIQTVALIPRLGSLFKEPMGVLERLDITSATSKELCIHSKVKLSSLLKIDLRIAQLSFDLFSRQDLHADSFIGMAIIEDLKIHRGVNIPTVKVYISKTGNINSLLSNYLALIDTPIWMRANPNYTRPAILAQTLPPRMMIVLGGAEEEEDGEENVRTFVKQVILSRPSGLSLKVEARMLLTNPFRVPLELIGIINMTVWHEGSLIARIPQHSFDPPLEIPPKSQGALVPEVKGIPVGFANGSIRKNLDLVHRLFRDGINVSVKGLVAVRIDRRFDLTDPPLPISQKSVQIILRK